MPEVSANGIKLHYESHGKGVPLLLISGVGYGCWIWYKQISVFSKHFHVIAFDNRGVGQSDKPDMPYTVPMLAQDTINLLNALDIEKAHVLGTSLGGMIAQQLVLDHPESVDHLILCATVFGGPNTVLPAPEVLQFMAQRSGTPEERFQQGFKLTFSQTFLDIKPNDLQRIKDHLSNPCQPDEAYQRQAMSPLGFNVEVRLGDIHHPALVLAGDLDQAVPVENARRLAKKLPNAQLKIFEGAGHLCFIERAEAFNEAVLDFLGGTA